MLDALSEEWSRPYKIARVLQALGMDVPRRLRRERFAGAIDALRTRGIEVALADGGPIDYADSPGIGAKIRLRLVRATTRSKEELAERVHPHVTPHHRPELSRIPAPDGIPRVETRVAPVRMTAKCLNAVPIRAPAIDWILDGKKTWEIRSRSTNIRGPIGLIRSKSLTVVGSCDIVDVVLLNRGLILANARAKMNERPEDCLGCVGHYAWVLDNVRRFEKAVPYKHPSGAVTWVKLDEKTTARVFAAK
ncbi:MAG TPA: hypothetical protein VGI39_13135 [Polyangiaceae bacterium]